jgi:hypothetical protein
MRKLLETFRLPGESQQISRIIEAFAEVYFASQPGLVFLHAVESLSLTATLAEMKSEDAVYALAYSMIILNNDLHDPQVRVSNAHHHSTFVLAVTAFSEMHDHRRIRGYPERSFHGSDFSPEYLVSAVVDIGVVYSHRFIARRLRLNKKNGR